MGFSDLSLISILAAAFAGMISGAIWYGIFAKPWMRAVGFDEQPSPHPRIYLVAIAAQLIIAVMFAFLFRHFPQVSLTDGMAAALFCWFGFCVAPMAVNHRFQSKGWDLTLIDGGYWLVVFLLQGAMIAWLG